MPKKAKPPSDEPAADSAETPPQPSAIAPEALRKVPRKTSNRKTAAKRSTGTRTGRKAADASQSTERRQPSDDEIRLRAYFIAERRVQMGIPGTEHDDWVEARRQLEAELAG